MSSNTNTITTSTSSTQKSGNIFQDVLGDAKAVEKELLGPSYPYFKNIQTPGQLGMSANGSLSTLGNDIDGLIAYTELLVSGGGNASSTGNPLGNQFFLKTGAKCLDASGAKQDRYLYFNFIPSGNIPFITQGLGGVEFTQFEGLIPGTLGDLDVLNPFSILSSFTSGSEPKCSNVTLNVTDNNNNTFQESHYVSNVDLANMDACIFPNGTNPITNKGCQQAFTTINDAHHTALYATNPPKPLSRYDLATQLYFAGLSGLALYILYKCMLREKA